MPTQNWNSRYELRFRRGESGWDDEVCSYFDDLAIKVPQYGNFSDRPAPGQPSTPRKYVAIDQDPITEYYHVGGQWVTLSDIDTHTDVSDSSGLVVESVNDIRYTASEAASVSVRNDGDQTATVNISAPNTHPDTTSVTAAYTANPIERVLADSSGGAFDVTLPAPGEIQEVTVKKVDGSGNAVTVATPNTETIDGQDSISISSQYVSRTIVSDGTNYFII